MLPASQCWGQNTSRIQCKNKLTTFCPFCRFGLAVSETSLNQLPSVAYYDEFQTVETVYMPEDSNIAIMHLNFWGGIVSGALFTLWFGWFFGRYQLKKTMKLHNTNLSAQQEDADESAEETKRTVLQFTQWTNPFECPVLFLRSLIPCRFFFVGSMDRHFNDTFVTTKKLQERGVNYSAFLNYHRVYCQHHELDHQDDEGKIREWLGVDEVRSSIPNINGCCSTASDIRIVSSSTRRFIDLRLRFDERSMESLLSIFKKTVGSSSFAGLSAVGKLEMIRDGSTVDKHHARKWMEHMLWIQEQIGKSLPTAYLHFFYVCVQFENGMGALDRTFKYEKGSFDSYEKGAQASSSSCRDRTATPKEMALHRPRILDKIVSHANRPDKTWSFLINPLINEALNPLGKNQSDAVFDEILIARAVLTELFGKEQWHKWVKEFSSVLDPKTKKPYFCNPPKPSGHYPPATQDQFLEKTSLQDDIPVAMKSSDVIQKEIAVYNRAHSDETSQPFHPSSGSSGSNPGGVYKSLSGQECYVKVPKTHVHARVEVLVSKLYKAVGVNSADVCLVTNLEETKSGESLDNRIGVASKLEIITDISPSCMAHLPGVWEGFPADAWLANWDVESNLKEITEKHAAFRCNTGGTLFYRAQGGDKDFPSDAVHELQSMKQHTTVFEDIDNTKTKKIMQCVHDIVNLDDSVMAGLVHECFVGSDYSALQQTELIQTLTGRKDKIGETFKVQLRDFEASRVEGMLKQSKLYVHVAG